MDVATYIFNNQYYPRLIDKVYYELRQQTWDYCMNMQKNACSQVTWMGPMSDFKKIPSSIERWAFLKVHMCALSKKNSVLSFPIRDIFWITSFVEKKLFSLKDMMKLQTLQAHVYLPYCGISFHESTMLSTAEWHLPDHSG